MLGDISKIKPKIIVGGTVACLAVAGLTGFGVYSVVSSAKDEANAAYTRCLDDAAYRIMTQRQLLAMAAQERDLSAANTDILRNLPADVNVITENGKIYVDVNDLDGLTLLVDEDDFIEVDGHTYVHVTIASGDSVLADSDEDNPDVDTQGRYIGEEYVVVDIDGSVIYLIKKGDTLSEISGRVAYSVDELAEYNHIRNVDLIYEGESLRIPVSEETAESIRQHQSQGQ